MRGLILFLHALLVPLAAAAQQCAPTELAGTGTRAVLELNTAGGAVAWWCPGRFTPSLTLYAVRWDAMTGPMRADIAALAASAPDQAVARIDRLRVTYATMPLESDALRPVWTPARERILVARPPNPVWTVARNGTYTTRPTYPVTDGTRGAVATSTRATVGATCGCVRLRVIDGSTVYCGVDGTNQLVAVCTRLPD